MTWKGLIFIKGIKELKKERKKKKLYHMHLKKQRVPQSSMQKYSHPRYGIILATVRMEIIWELSSSYPYLLA